MNRSKWRRWLAIGAVVLILIWLWLFLSDWQQGRALQDRIDLQNALLTIQGAIRNNKELNSAREINFEDIPLLDNERLQLNNYLAKLDELLQQNSTTQNLEARQVLANAVYGLKQAVLATSATTTSGFDTQVLTGLLNRIGPVFFVMLHFMEQATSQLTWDINDDWERHIPVQDFAAMGDSLARLQSDATINTENAANLLSQVGHLSQRALQEGVSLQVKQTLARAGLLAQLAVEAYAAGLKTAEDFAVLGEPVDFTLHSRRFATGDDPTPIAGILQPALADGAMAEALFSRISQADDALKDQKRAPELLAVVVEQSEEASITTLCDQVRAQRTHAFVVVLLDGGVAQEWTCHSVQSDQPNFGRAEAQRVCADLEVALCRPRGG